MYVDACLSINCTRILLGWGREYPFPVKSAYTSVTRPRSPQAIVEDAQNLMTGKSAGKRVVTVIGARNEQESAHLHHNQTLFLKKNSAIFYSNYLQNRCFYIFPVAPLSIIPVSNNEYRVQKMCHDI